MEQKEDKAAECVKLGADSESETAIAPNSQIAKIPKEAWFEKER